MGSGFPKHSDKWKEYKVNENLDDPIDMMLDAHIERTKQVVGAAHDPALDAGYDITVGDASDLLAFDCPCNPNDENTPGWGDMPYDIHFKNSGVETCPRCGRQFKLEMAWRVLLYEPLSVRFPTPKEDDEDDDG